jgi:RNA polymerase sigma factor (TIGR02999 family)
MSDVTRILSAIEAGDLHAAEQLLPLVYDELRKLAALQMAHDRPGETLNPTALVHEAYLRLIGDRNERRYHDRSHFFAAAATAMRHIRIDQVRRKKSEKHGGNVQRLELDDVAAVGDCLSIARMQMPLSRWAIQLVPKSVAA